LLGKPGGKIPLGRASCKWVDNIKIDIKRLIEMVWTGLIWLRIRIGGRLF
jgi:hypothetical protein